MYQLLDEAIRFATAAHAGQMRKASPHPYILHPLEAAVIVGSMTSDAAVLAAALLHDTVEDAGITPAELRARFGDRVAALVASETEDKRPDLPPAASWQARKEASLTLLRETDDLGIKMLYLGDKLSNLRSIARGVQAEGSAFWQKFNQTDPKKHHWYYRTIAEYTAELSCHSAWQEFDRLIRHLFETEI